MAVIINLISEREGSGVMGSALCTRQVSLRGRGRGGGGGRGLSHNR